MPKRKPKGHTRIPGVFKIRRSDKTKATQERIVKRLDELEEYYKLMLKRFGDEAKEILADACRVMDETYRNELDDFKDWCMLRALAVGSRNPDVIKGEFAELVSQESSTPRIRDLASREVLITPYSMRLKLTKTDFEAFMQGCKDKMAWDTLVMSEPFLEQKATVCNLDTGETRRVTYREMVDWDDTTLGKHLCVSGLWQRRLKAETTKQRVVPLNLLDLTWEHRVRGMIVFDVPNRTVLKPCLMPRDEELLYALCDSTRQSNKPILWPLHGNHKESWENGEAFREPNWRSDLRSRMDSGEIVGSPYRGTLRNKVEQVVPPEFLPWNQVRGTLSDTKDVPHTVPHRASQTPKPTKTVARKQQEPLEPPSIASSIKDSFLGDSSIFNDLDDPWKKV